MAIQHHLSDELLLDYATGALAEGWSIAVASHLALCPACRRRLHVMEAAGGELVADEAVAVEEDDDAWARMSARLASSRHAYDTALAPSPAPDRARHASAPVSLPEPLRSYLGGDLADLKWKALGRGAFHIPIPVGDGETMVRLLKIPAGKPVPEHSHGGRELTLVLEGSFIDGDMLYGRGDVEEADADLTHQPVATAGRDCICLAVTDAPLKFRSWLLRLVQPMLGI